MVTDSLLQVRRPLVLCWLSVLVGVSGLPGCGDDEATPIEVDRSRGGAAGSQAGGGTGGSGRAGAPGDAGGGSGPGPSRGGTGSGGDTLDAGTAPGADSGVVGADAGSNGPPLAGAELRYPVSRGAVQHVTAAHGLLKGASDPEADVLRVTALGAGALSVPEGGAAVSVGTTLGGSLSVRADGSFDYTPPVGATASLDEVAYSIGDGAGGFADSRVLFVLSPGALGQPGFEIAGDSGQFLAGNVVSGAGDFNGDGFDDVIVGARAAGRDQLYLILGRANPDAVDLGGEPAVSIITETSGLEDLGVAVSPAGRVNGDVFDDLIIGVHQEAVGPDVADALGGKAYVVFGSASPPAVIELATLESDQRGFVIVGAAGQDHLGFSVSGAGNVDGVGGDDLVLGAIGRFPGEGESPTDGKAYVVFGKSTFTPIDLGNLGLGGFVMNGEAGTSGEAGVAVTGVGDWNADGLGDVALSATKMNDAAGRVYVVYGKADANAVSLSEVAGSVGGFAIDGEGDNDQAGRSLCRGGDLGGSALPDLVIGAPNPAGSGALGKTYVVFGTSAPEGLSLSDVVLESGGDSARGFAIHAESGGDRSGLSASGVGDFDGDGVADLLLGANESAVGAPTDAGADVSVDGAAYLVFGVAAPNADVHLLGLPAARGLTLRGEAPGNAHLGFSVAAAGDVNGDHHPDVIIGAPQHDGSTGRAYVLLGHP